MNSLPFFLCGFNSTKPLFQVHQILEHRFHAPQRQNLIHEVLFLNRGHSKIDLTV